MSVEYHRKLFVRTCNRECWQYLKMYDLAHPYQSATNQPFTYANLTGSELKINFQTLRPNLLSEMYLRWLSRDPHGLFADIKHSDEFLEKLASQFDTSVKELLSTYIRVPVEGSRCRERALRLDAEDARRAALDEPGA